MLCSLISIICTIAIALSLGEIASIYPTAGGSYYAFILLVLPYTQVPSFYNV